MDQIRIVIIDDDMLMREGLKIILEHDVQLKVIGEAANGVEGVALTKQLMMSDPDVKPFDIALVDIRMPELNGVETVKQIKGIFPKALMIMLTTFDDEEYIVDALHHGAIGYLLKDISKDKLISAIKDAVNGELILSSKVATKLANFSKGMRQEVQVQMTLSTKIDLHFTDREREIARLLAKGFTNRQISQAVYLSEGTVKNYVSSIYSKIGVYDRAAAALYLREQLEN